MSEAKFDRLFNPRSIALIGEGLAWSGAAARAEKTLQESSFNGPVIEIKNEEATFQQVDLAILDVATCRLPYWLGRCGEENIPYAMLLASEQSGVWSQKDKETVSRILSKSALRIIGPDSMGFINLKDKIVISPFQGCFSKDQYEKVALISQSGDLGFAVASAARLAGTGFRYVITTGGTSDIDLAEVGTWILNDPCVKLMLFCLEGLRDRKSVV